MIYSDDPLFSFYQSYAYELKQQAFSQEMLASFCVAIWDFYKTNKRDFAWRNTIDSYEIVVSEIMLQQTQTQRVAHMYPLFLEKFQTFGALAGAPKQELLASWVGLGYNRRVLALQGIAQWVVAQHQGKLPSDVALLQACKGLGPATSASIVTFAFNMPTVFIETNVRAVFLHIFFNALDEISDKKLYPLVAATVDQINPREWYYALMDYGVFIKKRYKNPSRKSKHYNVQSKFIGSDRQIRGHIVRVLAQQKQVLVVDVAHELHVAMDRLQAIIGGMERDGFLVYKNDRLLLQE